MKPEPKDKISPDILAAARPAVPQTGPTGEYWNWNRSRVTSPGRYVEVTSYAEVQAVIRDPVNYPGPVSAVGSRHSVTDTIINDGGTLIALGQLSAILGLEEIQENSSSALVRVQAGCSLKALSSWLAERGYELSFQAEIGDATVGALTTGDSKDSSLEGPGYFSAAVRQIRYVDHFGQLISIDETANPAALADFRCCFGLLGVVVECLITVQRSRLCCSRFSAHRFSSTSELSEAIQARICDGQALQGNVLLPELAAAFIERFWAKDGVSQSLEMRAAVEQLCGARRLFIQQGGVGVRPKPPAELIHERWQFINHYSSCHGSEPRLDFQMYEHDLPRLALVLAETLKFVERFQASTGFKPHGWSFYAVRRSETIDKPYGLYSGGPGISFVFDPYFSDPVDPNWQNFCHQYNRVAIFELGAKVSPIQTQWLSDADLRIPATLVRQRFLTPYYSQFVTSPPPD